ncbi:MAG: hypothetical protein ACODAU_00080 [Myxococcota bacterium]
MDRIEDIDQGEAEAEALRLATRDGVFVGPSAAGAVIAARGTCRRIDRGLVVCILPDRGDRYLSSAPFAGLDSPDAA